MSLSSIHTHTRLESDDAFEDTGHSSPSEDELGEHWNPDCECGGRGGGGKEGGGEGRREEGREEGREGGGKGGRERAITTTLCMQQIRSASH